MIKYIFMPALLIISHLAVYHMTRITTEQKTIVDYKKSLWEVLFIMEEPALYVSNKNMKKITFNKLSRYGWDITESEENYIFVFSGQIEWQMSKDDLKTIRRIDTE